MGTESEAVDRANLFTCCTSWSPGAQTATAFPFIPDGMRPLSPPGTARALAPSSFLSDRSDNSAPGRGSSSPEPRRPTSPPGLLAPLPRLRGEARGRHLRGSRPGYCASPGPSRARRARSAAGGTRTRARPIVRPAGSAVPSTPQHHASLQSPRSFHAPMCPSCDYPRPSRTPCVLPRPVTARPASTPPPLHAPLLDALLPSLARALPRSPAPPSPLPRPTRCSHPAVAQGVAPRWAGLLLDAAPPGAALFPAVRLRLPAAARACSAREELLSSHFGPGPSQSEESAPSFHGVLGRPCLGNGFICAALESFYRPVSREPLRLQKPLFC